MSDEPQEPRPPPDWKEQALAAWRSFAEEKRRLWISGTVVAICGALLIWAVFRPNAYVDGVGVRQDAEWVELRDLVWEHPTPLVPDLNASEDFYDPTVSSDNLTLVFVKGRGQHPVNARKLFSHRTSGLITALKTQRALFYIPIRVTGKVMA